MTKVVKIFYLYADKCKSCEMALSSIESAINKCKEIPCQIIKFPYTSDVAVNIAIKHDIDDLPAFIVGSKVFKGKKYTEEKIIDAIKTESKKV